MVKLFWEGASLFAVVGIPGRNMAKEVSRGRIVTLFFSTIVEAMRRNQIFGVSFAPSSASHSQPAHKPTPSAE